MKNVLAFVMFLSGCGFLVDESEACHAATAQGFAECSVTGAHEILPHLMGGCGENDSVAFDVSATNPRGARVAIVVCCGWLAKGCTVRVR